MGLKDEPTVARVIAGVRFEICMPPRADAIEVYNKFLDIKTGSRKVGIADMPELVAPFIKSMDGQILNIEEKFKQWNNPSGLMRLILIIALYCQEQSAKFQKEMDRYHGN